MTADPGHQEQPGSSPSGSYPLRTRTRWQWPPDPGNMLALLLALIPIYALASQAMALVRYGVDIPYWDDWNRYMQGQFGSLDLAFLFQPGAGTVFAVGKALDSVEQLLLGGNTVVYQLLTMLLLLGLLLFFQFRLLRQALGGFLVTSAALLLTLPMLRADTYWGLVTLAFHQGIPTVALLGSLWLILRRSPVHRGPAVLIVAIGVVAGLSYISGAFAITTLGISMIAVSRLTVNPLRSNITRGGVLMAVAGAITVAIQLSLVFGGQGGQSSFTWPWDARFWVYYFGEIAGSLALPPPDPSPHEVMVLAVVVSLASTALLLMVVRSIRWLMSNRETPVHRATAPIILVSLTAVVAVYLAIVAAARAQVYVAPGATLPQIFANGLAYGHPFWVTLLWPWVGASFIQVVRDRRALFRHWPHLRRWVPYVAAFVALALVGASARKGSYDYQSWYSGVMRYKSGLVSCISTGLNVGVPLYCQPGEPSWDLTEAVLGAMIHEASFTRYVQFSPTPDSSPALFRLSGAGPAAINVSGADDVSATGDGWRIAAQSVAIASVTTGAGPALAQCHALEVTAIVRPEQQEIVHVFWAPADEPDALTISTWNVAPGGVWTSMHFFLISMTGFADSLRLHLAQAPGSVDLKDVQVRCRISS